MHIVYKVALICLWYKSAAGTVLNKFLPFNPFIVTGNGKIDFVEFVNLMILNGDQLVWNESDLMEAFRVFDSENKGYIVTSELRYVFTQMDEEDGEEHKIDVEEIEDMVKASNLEGHRKINFAGIPFSILLTNFKTKINFNLFRIIAQQIKASNLEGHEKISCDNLLFLPLEVC